MKKYNHFVNGKEMLPNNGEYFETENPYTCEKWAEVAKGNARDVDIAVNVAKDVFENNWSDRFANVRNMIAGTANAKESFPERWTDIDFVCYEVITPHLTPSQQFALIKKLNIISVIHKKMKKINKKVL